MGVSDKRYSPKGWAAKLPVIRRIEELEYKQTDTVANFYSKLHELHAEAKTMGITFDDFDIHEVSSEYRHELLIELNTTTYAKCTRTEKDPPSLPHIHERAIQE